MSPVPDLETLARLDCLEPIPPEQLGPALTQSPFISIPGTFNVRDLGLAPPGATTPKATRKGFAFRAGALDALADGGKQVLAEQLGVRRIFDLRSLREHARSPDPAVAGVENVWVKSKELDALVDLKYFVSGEGEEGYRYMYLDVLDAYQTSFRAVLEHVRDRPQEPFLFHCTAGRDRTGVLAGLLETLAGEAADTVAFGFILSRVGTEPAREKLVAFAQRGTGATSFDTPGFRNMCNLKTPCWAAFVDAVGETYGGFDGYVVKTLGFSEADLTAIKKNLSAKA